MQHKLKKKWSHMQEFLTRNPTHAKMFKIKKIVSWKRRAHLTLKKSKIFNFFYINQSVHTSDGLGCKFFRSVDIITINFGKLEN